MNAKRIDKIKKILADDKADRDKQVQLTAFWDTSPEYWRNFVRSLPIELSGEERISAIAATLVDYNAVRLDPNTLTFKTLAHKTWFILRWT